MMKLKKLFEKLLNLLVLMALIFPFGSGLKPAQAEIDENPADWPQVGHDAQRTNASPTQVDGPYCYAWKWYEAPIASRAQAVVSSGRLFIGSMDGFLYARNATTGAPLWKFDTGSPIRNSAAVYNGATVIFTNHSGTTYALNAVNGAVLWQKFTGPSATAPLINPNNATAYVGSTTGELSSLNIANGNINWHVNLGNAILTTPSLSLDGATVFTAAESMVAMAVNAANGSVRWQTGLQGQSMTDRYPVVAGNAVLYRSQPAYNFTNLLHEGDDVMDQAGGWSSSFSLSNWVEDWNRVRPKITQFLNDNPSKQTFFVLNSASGVSQGTAPVLYTYGNNDIPNVPVVQGGNIFLTYRARHGIQTDSNTVHVTTKYDAELGKLNVSDLNITPIISNQKMAGTPQFRMTSDEPAMLTMSGDLLLVDNWERLGGVNVNNGALSYLGHVSTDWPECFTQCGPGGSNPFFPMSGNKNEAAYPFPSPRVSEGRVRAGAVVANNMIYWQVAEGGLAAINHQSGSSCASPSVWGPGAAPTAPTTAPAAARPLADYLTLDLTTPKSNPPADLVTRLNNEMAVLVNGATHWMPYFLQRGFSYPRIWPYQTGKTEQPGQIIGDSFNGTAFWQDPGDLVVASAMAYPYLNADLKNQLKSYLSKEWGLFPPLQALPFNENGARDWLHEGQAREPYTLAYRSKLSTWPPPAASLNALYGIWLWSKNSGDWSYVQSHWNEAKALFNQLTPINHGAGKMNYLSDLAGVIGFYRIAVHLNDTNAANQSRTVALDFMQDVKNNLSSYLTRADQQYLDPRDVASGWSAPAFYGMTPEVGLFLREQTNGAAQQYLNAKEYGTNGNGLRWWYITRVGVHAEIGESSYIDPFSGWSHFMAHAYLQGNTQTELKAWLDRPWGKADLYSIEKVVAAIQAGPASPDINSSSLNCDRTTPKLHEQFSCVLQVINSGTALTGEVSINIQLPNGVTYVNGSMQIDPMSGAPVYANNRISWNGPFPESGVLTLSYHLMNNLSSVSLLSLVATVQTTATPELSITRQLIANGRSVYMAFMASR